MDLEHLYPLGDRNRIPMISAVLGLEEKWTVINGCELAFKSRDIYMIVYIVLQEVR